MSYKSLRASDEGQSVVEFALVLPLSLVIILAIVVFGIAFARMEAVENGAAEGGRAAQRWTIGGSMTCQQAVRNAVERTTPFSVTPGLFDEATNECSAPPGPVTDTLVCVSAVCPADTSTRVATGELITVHVVHDYVPVFFGTLFRDMWAPPNSFELHSEVTVMHE